MIVDCDVVIDRMGSGEDVASVFGNTEYSLRHRTSKVEY
jgi:hypothetical protein